MISSFKFSLKIKFFSLFFIISSVVFCNSSIVNAAPLFPSASPAVGSYTLQDIYNKLTTHTDAVSGGHDFLPISTPQSTFPLLSQIYNAIPSAFSLLASTTTVPVGLNLSTTTLSTIDTDLTASNIKSGTNIFGIVGSVIESLGNASTSEVLAGRTFSNLSFSNLTGTIPVKVGDSNASSTATSTNKIILTPTLGYYDGVATVSTTSTAFTAGNIRPGINLFGIVGTMSTGFTYGDDNAEKVLTTATGPGTYNVNNLTPSNVKSGVTYATSSVGTYTAPPASGYPSTGWVANGSGSGSTALNQANCEAASGSGWYWFEDANGDGITTGAEDGECVRATAGSATSWNGAILMNGAVPANGSSTASSGGVNTISSSTASWTVDAFKYHIAKINMGTANGCWGIVKSNTATTTTVYGSWLKSDYTACATNPDATSGFKVYDDNKYDNSWIGDYSCTGNFPTGTVVAGTYYTTENSALAQADCYDGKRDLLPNETDRAVVFGTTTATTSLSITDSSQNMIVNAWIGQKLLITSGTGNGSYGIIESNTATTTTVGSWSSTTPAVGDTYKIIYILPRASYVTGATMSQIINGTVFDDAKANKGPLSIEVLKAWKGTRLPTSMDFFGFCGAKSGDSYSTAGDSAYKSSGASPKTALGNYGSNVGRGKNSAPNDEYIYLSNSGSWEWLSEQHYSYFARLAGTYACSAVLNSNVVTNYRFRALFRP
jgi:hypothetical protein